MTHLAVAYELLERCADIKDKGVFLVGSIAPDAAMFRPGAKREDKAPTHFCVGDQGWGYYTNYAEWEENLVRNIAAHTGRVDGGFLFGYMAHVYADIENSRRFWTPARLTNDQKHIDSYLADCFEADSVLLSEIKHRDEMWEMLGNPGGLFMPGFVTVEDIGALVRVMKNEWYNESRLPEGWYEANVLTMDMVREYIGHVADRMVEYREAFHILKN